MALFTAVSRAGGLATLALAAITMGSAPLSAPAQQPSKPAPPKKPSPPMAVIVVQQGYSQPGRKLADVAKDSAELAVQLRNAGYKVRLITDPQSEPEAQGVVKAGKVDREIPIATIETATALEKELSGWMTAVSGARPALALMVLTGHGVERAVKGKDEPYFLTVGDDPANGGVSVTGLRNAAAECAPKGLYLAMVYNACRAVLNEKPAAALPVRGADGKPVRVPESTPQSAPDTAGNFEWLKDRERDFVLTGRAAHLGEPLTPTILFSTRSGEKAVASKSVVYHLADALRDHDSLTHFLKLMAPDRKDKPDLTLYDWFHFAVARVQGVDLTQSHELVLGSVPLGQPVARRNRGPFGPPEESEVIDILAERPTRDMGELEFDLAPRLGLVVTRPKEKIQFPWVGFAVGKDHEIDPTGRYLELDAIAWHPDAKTGSKSKQKASVAALTFAVNPAHREAVDKHVNLTDGGIGTNSSSITMMLGHAYRIAVPLKTYLDASKKVRPLNGIGLSPTTNDESGWPRQASLTITSLEVKRLMPGTNPLYFRPIPVPSFGMLVPGDWGGGDSFGREPRLRVAEPDQTKEPWAVYRLDPEPGAKGKSRCGDRIRRACYVPPGYALQVEAWKPSGTAELTVDLVYEDPVTGVVTAYADRHTITVGARGSPPARIALQETGFVNYLRLSTSDKDIHVKSIRLVPPK